jgi:hypothetical protein
MGYNMTAMWESKNLLQIWSSLNTASNGLFFSIFLFSFFVLVLMIFPNTDFAKLLMLDSFIVTIFAIFGFVLGFIGWSVLMFPIIILIGSVIFYKINN